MNGAKCVKWADVLIYEWTGAQPVWRSRALLLLLLLLTHQLKVRGAQPSPALSYTLCYINAASRLRNLSGDFIDPLRCYISDYLVFSFPQPPIALWLRGGEDLHAPGLQIQQTRTKNYIIVSSGGSSSRRTSRLYEPKSFVTTFERFLSCTPDAWCFGWVWMCTSQGSDVAIHTDGIGWTSAPISCRRPTRSAGRWQEGRGPVLPWEWGEILHRRAQMVTWPPPWVQRCGRTGDKGLNEEPVKCWETDSRSKLKHCWKMSFSCAFFFGCC